MSGTDLDQTDSAEKAGFDRRSLIKKGLVVGGAAATLPVITTFNSPAFVASVPGLHQVDWVQPILGGLLNGQPSRVNVVNDECTNDLTLWPGGTPDNAGLVTMTGVRDVGLDGNFTFTLTGSYASCEFVEATVRIIAINGLLCISNGDPAITGYGTNQLVYNPDLLGDLAVLGLRIHLLVSC